MYNREYDESATRFDCVASDDGSGQMNTTMIEVETYIPDDVYLALQAQGLHRSDLARESQRLLAQHFLQNHTLSLGKAAKLANMSLWEFTAYLSDNNVPVVDLDNDELAAEFSAATQLAAEIGNAPIA